MTAYFVTASEAVCYPALTQFTVTFDVNRHKEEAFRYETG